MKRYEFKIKHYLILIVVLITVLFIKNYLTYKKEVNEIVSDITVDEIESIEVSVNDNGLFSNYSDKFTITDDEKIREFVEIFNQMTWKKGADSYSYSTNYSNYRFDIHGRTRYINIDIIQNRYISILTHTKDEGFKNYKLKASWPVELGYDFFKFME
ncbi:MAG: hypothetical protein JEZ08_03740 [Clostridiales bacterium]|nr:hypothetical protein [Clostridiales bacterium]